MLEYLACDVLQAYVLF